VASCALVLVLLVADLGRALRAHDTRTRSYWLSTDGCIHKIHVLPLWFHIRMVPFEFFDRCAFHRRPGTMHAPNWQTASMMAHICVPCLQGDLLRSP
jgi:hypothetical protein